MLLHTRGDEVILRVVSVNGAVAAAIRNGNLAVERVDLKTIGHAGRIHRLDQLAEGVALNLRIRAGG